MKALRALVSFWIFLSLFRGSDWLKGTNSKCQKRGTAKEEMWLLQGPRYRSMTPLLLRGLSLIYFLQCKQVQHLACCLLYNNV